MQSFTCVIGINLQTFFFSFSVVIEEFFHGNHGSQKIISILDFSFFFLTHERFLY